MSNRRSSRRQASADRKRSFLENQIDWQIPRYADKPIEPLSSDQIEAIHQASLDILENTGILFLNEEALDVLEEAGCDVDRSTQNVRMDRAWVEQQVSLAPASFDVLPRNPDRKVTFGKGHFLFSPVASPPNVLDRKTGRRAGNYQDFTDFIKLAQSFNCLHALTGYPVEPVDVHASVRHLHCVRDMLVLTDKVVHAYSLGKERIEDAVELVRIAAGLTMEEFVEQPRMFTNINSSSPLKHDYPMLDGAMRMAKLNQPVFITPFTLAGAMAPVTVAGAIVQQNAESLAAISLLQTVRAGSPVVYGAFTSNVDMRSGAPAFGTPEYVRAMQISGQMARYYDLPWRGSNANASNAPDAQAMWESAFSLNAVMAGHASFVFHGAGWLEGGLSASKEKMVMDCEMLQQLIHLQREIPFDLDDLAVDAISEVGPHGHFFGCEHTQSRYKTAFYSPLLSDWSNYESWQEKGSVWAHERAEKAAEQILDEYQAPPLDEAILEELDAFVAKRVEEGGAPTDF